MTYTPIRLVVTGGAGFIGCHFIQYLLQRYPDIQIFNIDKLTYASSPTNLVNIEKDSRYIFIQQDICVQPAIEDILRINKIDTIVHFAAESHVDRSINSPDEFIQTNVVGTYSLLQAARKIWIQEADINRHRFHHISTDEVFGSLEKNSPSFSELTAYNPRSPYSASKASSDHLVQAYYHTYGLNVTISNCSNNYGPYQHQEKLIPTIIYACLKQKPIPIYNDGSNIRDWLYVEDHCHAIDLIIRRGTPGENYNIGANTEYSNYHLTQLLCEIIAEQLKKPVTDYLKLIQFVDDRPGHDFRYAINSEKIKKQLGWQPIYQMREGLKKTVQWYLREYIR